ncbi:MAG: dihydrofolate reductase family protein [Dehalococcoidia bacterium]
MRKLVESTFVTLDGVIGSPQEWGPPYWNDEHANYARGLLFDADALLLGRVTYEVFAQAWPSRSGDEMADKMNAMPKYVASNTLKDATWNASIIGGDVAGEVATLKERPGKNLLKFGTGVFDRAPMEHNLVDEFHFWLFPVAVGGGQRLFEGIDTTHLTLKDTTTFSTGIVVLKYGPKG